MKDKSKKHVKKRAVGDKTITINTHNIDDQYLDEVPELVEVEEEFFSQTEFEKILSSSKNTYAAHENILYRYYFEVGKYPLLTATEEKIYGLASKSGDIDAYGRLFNGNLRLVIMIAQRYQNQGVELQDLISEGNLGVMHAISKFEPEKGFRFSTYAVWWIRHYLSNAIMNNGRTIRIPIHVSKAIRRLLSTRKELSQSLNREPTVNEIAIETGQSIFEVMSLLANYESTLSLDAAITNDQESGDDFYHIVSDDKTSDAAEVLIGSETFSILTSILNQLEQQEREVIEYRFGINGKPKKTLECTGEILGLTRDQVRYSQMKALDALKKIFQVQGIQLSDILNG